MRINIDFCNSGMAPSGGGLVSLPQGEASLNMPTLSSLIIPASHTLMLILVWNLFIFYFFPNLQVAQSRCIRERRVRYVGGAKERWKLSEWEEWVTCVFSSSCPHIKSPYRRSGWQTRVVLECFYCSLLLLGMRKAFEICFNFRSVHISSQSQPIYGT